MVILDILKLAKTNVVCTKRADMGRARAVSCFAGFEGQRMRVRHIWELGRKIWFTECVLAQGDEEEKEVTASDQADINAFSIRHNQCAYF